MSSFHVCVYMYMYIVYVRTDKVLSITRVTADVKDVISAEVMVVEGGYSPLLLPPDTDTLLSTSVQLATLLGQYTLH